MSGFEFDRALELRPGKAPGEMIGDVDDRWMIGKGVNGGLLMCLAAAALRSQVDRDGAHPDPLALSAYFVLPTSPGPISLTTTVLRAGRTMSTGQVVLSQPGPDDHPQERMRALATFGDLGDRMAPHVRSAPAPVIPPPEECVSRQAAPDFLQHSSLVSRMDLRLDPVSAGWLHGKPSGLGVLSGWVRFSDGREPDPMALLWALDALPPVAFDLGLYGWVPTLEFSAHLRGRPAPGWLQVQLRTENVIGGLMEEDARIWDSGGRLVALSRQLCGFRLPR
jgi:acyl-CoA thioesterase